MFEVWAYVKNEEEKIASLALLARNDRKLSLRGIWTPAGGQMTKQSHKKETGNERGCESD